MSLFSKLKKNKCKRWVAKDWKTKFRIFTLSTINNTYENGAKILYKNIKDRFYNQFLTAKKLGKRIKFTTDGLAHYMKGFNKFFRNVAELTHGVPIKAKKSGLKHNNNCIERDHQYSRKLEKNARGHKSVGGISALFDIGDIYFNYIDKQRLMKRCEKTKKWVPKEKRWRTPAQRAKINLQVGNRYQLVVS